MTLSGEQFFTFSFGDNLFSILLHLTCTACNQCELVQPVLIARRSRALRHHLVVMQDTGASTETSCTKFHFPWAIYFMDNSCDIEWNSRIRPCLYPRTPFASSLVSMNLFGTLSLPSSLFILMDVIRRVKEKR